MGGGETPAVRASAANALREMNASRLSFRKAVSVILLLLMFQLLAVGVSVVLRAFLLAPRACITLSQHLACL